MIDLSIHHISEKDRLIDKSELFDTNPPINIDRIIKKIDIFKDRLIDITKNPCYKRHYDNS